jgi:streptogramin lyase
MRFLRLRALLFAGLVAATSLIGDTKAEGQVTVTPTFSYGPGPQNSQLIVTISDITPDATIYYTTGGRTPSTNSIEYTGPLTVTLPITLEAIAVVPGYSNSVIASVTYANVVATTTTLNSSSNPSVLGQSVIFMAKVSQASGSIVPTGSVQFSVNDALLGSPVTLNAAGVATYSSSILPEGYLNIAAAYLPSSGTLGNGSSFFSSASSALTQAVYSSQHQSNNVWFNSASKTLGNGFKHPYGVAVDANGNVFVADSGNSAVKEIVAASGYTTINSLGGGFSFPAGIAIDATGNLFVGDIGNGKVYEILAAGGYTTVTSIGGTAPWNQPTGVAVDSNNNVFVADSGLGSTWELPATSGYGSSNALFLGVLSPWGVAVDAHDNLFVTSTQNHTVNESLAPPGYSSSAILDSSFFVNPYGIAVDANDNLFVTDVEFEAVREISLVNGWTTIATPSDELNLPLAVAVDAADNVYVADTDNNAVKEFSSVSGNFGTINVGSTSSTVVSMYFFFDVPTTLGSTTIVYPGGATNAEFTDAGTGTCWPETPYTANATCRVDVSFTPIQTGARSGLVELFDTSGSLLASGTVQGFGVAQ